MSVRVTKKRISSIALISFTDVIFLLIIFILISSSFITHSGIKVNLPGSGSQQNEFNKNINLTITKNDELYIDNEKTDWKNLPRLLNEKLIDDPEQVVVIRADEDIPLKKIVRLLDLAKLSGTNRFFIATEIDLKESNFNE
jgi:biopolymer transport protein ExbD